MIYVLYIYSKITNKISLRIKLNLLVQIKKKQGLSSKILHIGKITTILYRIIQD